MRKPSKERVTRAAVLVALILACGDPTSPGGGGVNTESHTCGWDKTSGWDNNSLTINVTSPDCPFTIQSINSWLDVAAIVTTPTDNINYDTFGGVLSYVNIDLMSAYTSSRFGGATYVYFHQDPNNSSSFRAEPQFSATPGYYPSIDSASKMLDSLQATAIFLRYSNAIGWKILPGRITSGGHTMLGPGGFVWGTPVSWRAKPDWDTTAYRYKWLLDGQQIANATHATYAGSLGTAGTHALSSVAIRSDNSADTVTFSVAVGIAAAISGPSTVVENNSGHWVASADGGSPAYHYQWYADGSPVGGDNASLDMALGPGGTNHRLQVDVTDSHGATGSGVYDVYADYANCPGCDPYIRLAPEPTSPAKGPAVRRRGH